MEENLEFDVVIIGSGLAGIYCALSLDETLNIAIVSNGSIDETNSYLAQGGVAAPVGVHDSAISHFNDTMSCGHFRNHEDAVKQLTECAKDEIDTLIQLGVRFDLKSDGSYELGMEGAHSCARILRIGDYTGKSIMESLLLKVKERKNITRIDQGVVYALGDHQVDVLADGDIKSIFTKVTVIATGGMGRLYSRSSNNPKITGDGIALALQAGITVSHLNWIQFHPTVFYNIEGPQMGFLISEAVRGDGAYLLNEKGERFMVKYHQMLELAPRDIVSSAILHELKHQEKPYVWLDVRHIGNEKMAKRFPTIYAHCRKLGLDLDQDLIPVAPGAHYAMGGIKVDLNGRTSKSDTYAIGECAYTGVHGKNRLASNSLLEAIVFAKKAAKDIMRMNYKHERVIQIHPDYTTKIPHYDVEIKSLSTWMDLNMGIEKNYAEITVMKAKLDQLLKNPASYEAVNISDIKTNNVLIVMKEMLKQALQEYEDEKE